MKFARSARIAAMGCFLAITAACGGSSDEQDSVVVVQEWFPYSGFAGEALAVAEYGPDNGVSMSLLAGGDTANPITRVRNGEATIGVASASEVISAAIEGNYDLRVIGVVNEQSPTVFLAPEGLNVRTSRDFVGRRVGILEGTNTEAIYRLMMARNGIADGTIEEIPVPFTVDSFRDGQYDIRPAFVYDETVTLDNAGFKYSIVYPGDEGVDFLGTVYFTTREALEGDRREAIVLAVRSLVQSWAAIANPDSGAEARERAIAALKAQFPEIDEQRERDSLDIGFRYFRSETGGPLYASRERWQATVQGLAQLGQVNPDLVDLDRLIDDTVRADACRGLDICD